MLTIPFLTPIFISIHALRKESDSITIDFDNDPDISIHALRKESDRFVGAGATVATPDFNPRSP